MQGSVAEFCPRLLELLQACVIVVLDQFIWASFPFTSVKNCCYSIALLDGAETEDIF